MKTYRSYSSAETRLLGASLVKKLLRDPDKKSKISNGAGKRHVSKKHALVLALTGDLGSGKTTFAQGFLRGLGVRGRVNSPTFVLVKRFAIPASVKTSVGRHGSRFKNAYHIDCYRVKKSAELSSLGLKEIFENPENIVLVEWPERLGKVLPKRWVSLVFKHGKDMKRREIKVI